METILTILFGVLAVGVLAVTALKVFNKKIPMIAITIGKYGTILLVLLTLIYYLFIH